MTDGDTVFSWRVGDQSLTRTSLPLLMGILNVTPDSFSDGGLFKSRDKAIEQALQLAEDGANIIDVGGESTRPGAVPVSLAEELQRTIPVITEICRRIGVPVSIDTTKAEVARQAIAAGALIVNDISGMTFDAKMSQVCAEGDAAVCVMHILGTPETMQVAPVYNNVVKEVSEFLGRCLKRCAEAGMSSDRICLDPGIGFGKTADHNLQLMQAIHDLQKTHRRPVLIGHSRKRFLSKILGRGVDERTFGTAGVSIALAENGADVLRVHDVRATKDALLAWDTVRVHRT